MWKFLGIILWIWCACSPSLGQRAIALLNSPARALPETLRRTTTNQVQLDFQVINGMVYLEGQLNGESSLYILDTGAPTLVLNEAPSSKSDSEFVAYSCAGELKVSSRVISSFWWGTQNHRQINALTLDMSHLGSHDKHPRGLIGYELFKDQVLCLDYHSQRLTIVNSKQWKQLQRTSEPLIRMPLHFYGHLPVISIEKEGQSFNLGIDTGAAANLISPSALDVFTYSPSSRPREELQGLDQQVQVVDAVQFTDLWDNQLEAHRFLLTEMNALNADNDWQLDGLLGYEFLSRYRVVIDYPNKELSIWPL